MTADEWLTAFAAAAGIDAPDPSEVAALLDLAGIAAHASERTAAPVTCWLAARAGLSTTAALEAARALADANG
jgi:hypothetical protein